jgi:hypothetical protein
VLSEQFFGAAEVTMFVPEHLYTYFAIMPPFAKKMLIPGEILSPKSLELWRTADPDLIEARKTRFPKPQAEKLVLGMRSHEHQLFLSTEIKWFLEHGVQVESVGQILPAQPGYPFKEFVNKLVDLRRSGDCLTCFQNGIADPGKWDHSKGNCEDHVGLDGCELGPSSKLQAALPKITANSFYGTTITDKGKFSITTYGNDETLSKATNNSKKFERSSKLNENFNEITRKKASHNFTHPAPVQVGWAILQYSKHHMRRFVFDCLDKFIDRGSYKLILTDTDSMVVGLAAATLDECIKEELREEWHSTGRNEFFPPHGTSRESMYAYRTPGLFKSEFEASHVVALAAKSYFQFNDTKTKDNFKMSQKGVSKDQNPNLKKYEAYVDILGGESCHATCNSIRTFVPLERPEGSRAKQFDVSENFTTTLRSSKMISACYDKMYLHDDSIHCSPLDKWEPMTALEY